jgi:hypothetical protein
MAEPEAMTMKLASVASAAHEIVEVADPGCRHRRELLAVPSPFHGRPVAACQA